MSELPAWSLPADAVGADRRCASDWPAEVTREWAWGGSTGAGVRVCILDSGVDGGASARRRTCESAVVGRRRTRTARRSSTEDIEGDVCGHGTACAGIVRALAPEAELHSVRVLGPGFTGSGNILLAGLRYAIEQGFDVDQHEPLDDEEATSPTVLHELADAAYFQRHGARRLRAQHAGRELPVALLVGDLRRQPRGGRPDRALLQPEPAGRVLRAAASTSTSPGSAASTLRCTGQQLRDAARRRDLRADPRRSIPS